MKNEDKTMKEGATKGENRREDQEIRTYFEWKNMQGLKRHDGDRERSRTKRCKPVQ